jgi:tetratricopeptide (TPR) repeat protein
VNKIILLITASLLLGCSTGTLNRRISDPARDGLATESWQRYGKNRLVELESLYQNDSINSGRLKCHEGKISEGLAILGKESANNPNRPEVWDAQGICWLFEARNDLALFSFNEAWRLASKSSNDLRAQIANNIGFVYAKMHLAKKAELHFKESLKIKATLTAKSNLAHLYIRYGLIDQAADLLQDLTKRAPGDIDGSQARAIMAIARGEYSKALAELDSIASEGQDREDILTYRGLTLHALGHYEEALAVLTSVNFFGLANIRDLNVEIKQKAQAALNLQKENERLEAHAKRAPASAQSEN